MSQPTYVRNAKRKWKTLKKMLERFYKEHGRQMNYSDYSKALKGGR